MYICSINGREGESTNARKKRDMCIRMCKHVLTYLERIHENTIVFAMYDSRRRRRWRRKGTVSVCQGGWHTCSGRLPIAVKPRGGYIVVENLRLASKCYYVDRSIVPSCVNIDCEEIYDIPWPRASIVSFRSVILYYILSFFFFYYYYYILVHILSSLLLSSARTYLRLPISYAWGRDDRCDFFSLFIEYPTDIRFKCVS